MIVTRSGSRVELGGVTVARSSARIRVPAGTHTVTFRFANGEVRAREVTVSGATELTVAELPSRNAPPSVGRAVVAAATVPPGLLDGLLDGAATVPDTPASGWRLPEPPAPVLPAPPSPLAARPGPEPALPASVAPAVLSGPGPVSDPESGPVTGPEPGSEPGPRTDASAGPPVVPPSAVAPPPATAESCPGDASALSETAEARMVAGDYPSARACLLQLTAAGGDRVDVLLRLSALDRAIAIEAGLEPDVRAYVRALRLRAVTAAARGEWDVVVDASADLMSLVPGDPALVSHLRAIPSGGFGPAYLFVPGPLARPDGAEPGQAGVPLLGFLLSPTEVSNAQFAVFLNEITESDLPYLTHRPLRLELTRRDGWQPVRDAADLPVVDATWHGAAAYARWVGARLPTEAEWVWAYRSGTTAESRAGAHLSTGDPSGPVAVTASAPDALGLHHMLGNVWEWLGSDLLAPSEVAVAGGSYTTSPSVLDNRLTLRSPTMSTQGHVGFRVARSLSAMEPEAP